MFELFPNRFAISNVFAYLYGIKTWRGSTRKLADSLRMPESSLRAIMSSLIDEGYIRKTAEGYQCVYAAQESAQKSAHESECVAQRLTADAQKCAVAAPLSPIPPITNKIKKEKENISFINENNTYIYFTHTTNYKSSNVKNKNKRKRIKKKKKKNRNKQIKKRN